MSMLGMDSSTIVPPVLPEQLSAALAKRLDRAWPGAPFPLGANWDGEGTNFALWSTTATAVSVCLFDANGLETRIPLGDRTYHVWHGYVPGVGPGSALRLPRRRPVRTRRRACSTTRPSCCSTPTRAPSRATSSTTRRCTRATAPTPRPASPVGHRPGRVPVGRRPPPERAVGRHRHLRAARARVHPAAPGHPAGTARHLRRARPPGGDRPPALAGRHRRRADADPRTSSPSRTCSAAARATTGATTRVGFFAPHAAYATQPGDAAMPCASSRRWCARCTRPASR